MCYILLYIACYITCYVQAGLLDPPRIENQWCFIAGYIPQYIARPILSAIQHMVMLYSVCIYHAIQQLGYIASHIYSILLYSTYVMLYSTCIYHAIQQVRLYMFPHIQHLAIQHICYAIQHMLRAGAVQHPAIQHIDQLYSNYYSRGQSYIAPVQAIQRDPRFQMALSDSDDDDGPRSRSLITFMKMSNCVAAWPHGPHRARKEQKELFIFNLSLRGCGHARPGGGPGFRQCVPWRHESVQFPDAWASGRQLCSYVRVTARCMRCIQVPAGSIRVPAASPVHPRRVLAAPQ